MQLRVIYFKTPGKSDSITKNNETTLNLDNVDTVITGLKFEYLPIDLTFLQELLSMYWHAL